MFAYSNGGGCVHVCFRFKGFVYLGACGSVRATWVEWVIICYVCVVRLTEYVVYVLLVAEGLCVVQRCFVYEIKYICGYWLLRCEDVFFNDGGLPHLYGHIITDFLAGG